MASFFYADIKTDELQIHGHNPSVPAQIELLDANASNMVIIKAPLSLSQPNVIITLPSSVSNTNSLMMNTSGTGALELIAPSGDLSMANYGTFIVNGISNTATITSAANINLASGKQLNLGTANIGYDSNTNMILSGSNQVITRLGGQQVFSVSYTNGNALINMGSVTGESGIGFKNTSVDQIQVKPNSGSAWSNIVTHLPNLGDVQISGLANNNILTYNTTNSRWVNQANVYVRGSSDSNGLALIPGTDNRASVYVDWQPGTNIISYPASLALNANGAVKWAAAFNNSKGDSTLNEYIVFSRNGVKTGAISNNSTGTAYVTTSDYRLKSNVSPMTNGLYIVNQMKPVNFTWISTGANDSGFIAHELQTVVPSAVTGEKDELAPDGTPEYQGVDTSMLICYMVDAIKQLSSRVSQLESQISNI
jgi:hypothetical protein